MRSIRFTATPFLTSLVCGRPLNDAPMMQRFNSLTSGFKQIFNAFTRRSSIYSFVRLAASITELSEIRESETPLNKIVVSFDKHGPPTGPGIGIEARG